MNKHIYIVVLAGLFFCSCKKFVQVDPPKTQLITATVFTSDSTAISAMRGVYSTIMANEGFASGGAGSITYLAGLSADEFTNYSTDPLQGEFYQNALTVTNNTLQANLWSEPYKYIYATNDMLAGLDNSTGVSAAVKQQLKGEAKFMRAFCNFYLVNLFGDVPLITSTDYHINTIAPRAPKAQVYQQIIADLKDAQSLLADTYVFSANERIRPNKFAATALLARAYLYTGDWANAETQASAVISNTTLYSLLPKANIGTVFLKNSKEAIWQLLPVIGTINTYEGKNFILTTTPTKVTLSPQLLASFEPGDVRYTTWVKSITVSTPAPAKTYYYSYKYTVPTGGAVSEYSMVLRLAEQYLIRAEARVQQNNTIGGKADVDTIRVRAGLPVTTATTQPALLAAIEQERKVEFFVEWGHRWLDIKRTGRADAVFSVNKPGWRSIAALFPIPQVQITNDPNTTQNDGY